MGMKINLVYQNVIVAIFTPNIQLKILCYHNIRTFVMINLSYNKYTNYSIPFNRIFLMDSLMKFYANINSFRIKL